MKPSISRLFVVACVAVAIAVCGSPPDADAQTCTRTTAIACGATVTDTLAPTDHACRTFSGRLNEVVSVTTARVAGSATTFQPCWRVVGPNGVAVAGFVCNAQAEARLSQGDGTYTIEVTDQANDTAGTYVLSFDGVSATLDGVPSCGETIDCGATLERTTSTAGETNTFHFTARQGEVVGIATASVAGPTTFVPCWELFAPSGTRVGGTCGLGPLTLTENGTYTVKVADSPNDQTGTYDVNLHPLSATFNGVASCNLGTLSCGIPTITNGTLAAPGQEDTYVFAGRQNEVVSVTAVRIPGSATVFLPCWRVFGPNGTALSGFICNTQAEVRLNQGDGMYTVEIEDNSLDATGVYHLSFEAVSGTLDGTPNCAEPIGCGQTLERSIDTEGETDTFGFSGNANDVVALTVTRDVPGTFTPCWELFTPSGTRIATACDSIGSVTLPETGAYTVKVSENGNDQTGAYDLNLHPLSATLAGATCNRPELGCGAATVTDTLANAADADTYVFAGQQNEVVSVTAVRAAGAPVGFVPCWRVFGPNGRTLTPFVCGQQGETKLTEGEGQYTVEIVDSALDSGGSYHLSFEAVSATLDGAPNCAPGIACAGATVRRSLAEGETTTLQFAGTAAGSVTISIAKITGGSTFTPCWELFAPSGAKVRGTTCTSASVTLTETGVQIVKVFDSGYESPGTTDITLSGGGCIPICGDVNGDATVDIGDALVAAQYDVGLRVCRTAPFINPELCDVNQDSACNIGDALRIAQCSVGLVSCTFTCRPFSCP